MHSASPEISASHPHAIFAAGFDAVIESRLLQIESDYEVWRQLHFGSELEFQRRYLTIDISLGSRSSLMPYIASASRYKFQVVTHSELNATALAFNHSLTRERVLTIDEFNPTADGPSLPFAKGVYVIDLQHFSEEQRRDFYAYCAINNPKMLVLNARI